MLGPSGNSLKKQSKIKNVQSRPQFTSLPLSQEIFFNCRNVVILEMMLKERPIILAKEFLFTYSTFVKAIAVLNLIFRQPFILVFTIHDEKLDGKELQSRENVFDKAQKGDATLNRRPFISLKNIYENLVNLEMTFHFSR